MRIGRHARYPPRGGKPGEMPRVSSSFLSGRVEGDFFFGPKSDDGKSPRRVARKSKRGYAYSDFSGVAPWNMHRVQISFFLAALRGARVASAGIKIQHEENEPLGAGVCACVYV